MENSLQLEEVFEIYHTRHQDKKLMIFTEKNILVRYWMCRFVGTAARQDVDVGSLKSNCAP